MSKKNILIITGGSKGIGLGLVKQYTTQGFQVFSLSRTINTEITELKSIQQIEIDLIHNSDLTAVFNLIFDKINKNTIKSITLINNAGTLGTISNLENISITNIENSVKLNLSIPLQLSSIFIKATQKWNCTKKIINISSGAAINPYEGWSVYCSTKSAIDMFTKTVAKEQENTDYPVKINSIYPGVVATNMQEQIRNTAKKDFKNVKRFIELHETGNLSNAIDVARKIYAIDVENYLDNGAVFDIRNFNLSNPCL